MPIEDILFGLTICLFAGLSTSIGSGVIYLIDFKDKDLSKILSISLGISAGVMIGISIFELIPYTLKELGFISTSISFFIGFIGIMTVDFLIPHSYKEENTISFDPGNKETKDIGRVGYLAALGLAIHNLPEGLTSFSGFIINPILGLTTALAIAIHNIPEGFSVSVPLAASGKNKNFAFFLGSFSGLMEPLGAIIYPFIDIIGPLITLVLPFVAGIMIFISIDELLPLAFKYNLNNLTNLSILIGMMIMVLTLLILD